MIISVHIPKTAGTSFRVYLESVFGDGVARDYGLHSPETSPSILYCMEGWRFDLSSHEFLRRCQELHIQAIHGHFFARVYHRIVPEADYLCWLRDPVDRLISEFNQMRHHRDPLNPVNIKVNDGELSLTEFARLEMQRNKQYRFLEGINLSAFAFIGICEDFEQSIKRFNTRFELPQAMQLPHENITTGCENHITGKERSNIRKLNTKDVRLYEQALELVSKQG